MSWKVYSLGSQPTINVLAPAVVNKLNELGYEASHGTFSSKMCDLSVTVDGVIYTGKLQTPGTSTYPFYLWVNDETNDILVTVIYTTMASPTENFMYHVSFGLMSGTNIKTGESGLFAIAKPGESAVYFSNPFKWSDDSAVLLVKAFFIPYSEYITTGFVSTIYWGTMRNDPGIVIEVGSDKFVCLAGWLYAKL